MENVCPQGRRIQYYCTNKCTLKTKIHIRLNKTESVAYCDTRKYTKTVLQRQTDSQLSICQTFEVEFFSYKIDDHKWIRIDLQFIRLPPLSRVDARAAPSLLPLPISTSENVPRYPGNLRNKFRVHKTDSLSHWPTSLRAKHK